MYRTILVLACALFAGSLYAADTKIGYINTERVIKDSGLSVKASKRLEKEFAAREQEVSRKIKQLRDQQAALEKEALTLSETERNKRQRDLAALSREVENDKRAFREDVNQRRQEELSQLQERARKVIQEIAEREHYDLILENAVYNSPRVDLTDRVLKALDR